VRSKEYRTARLTKVHKRRIREKASSVDVFVLFCDFDLLNGFIVNALVYSRNSDNPQKIFGYMSIVGLKTAAERRSVNFNNQLKNVSLGHEVFGSFH